MINPNNHEYDDLNKDYQKIQDKQKNYEILKVNYKLRQLL